MDHFGTYTAKELHHEREAHEAALKLLAEAADLENARALLRSQLDAIIAEQDARNAYGNRIADRYVP